jgi:hypothetical protein
VMITLLRARIFMFCDIMLEKLFHMLTPVLFMKEVAILVFVAGALSWAAFLYL